MQVYDSIFTNMKSSVETGFAAGLISSERRAPFDALSVTKSCWIAEGARLADFNERQRRGEEGCFSFPAEDKVIK